MERLTPSQIFSKTMIFNILKSAVYIVCFVVSLITLTIISSIRTSAEGKMGIISVLIWLVISVGVTFLADFFIGYKIKAGHAAIVIDMISVGMEPSNMWQDSQELVTERFSNCNDYLKYKLAVYGTICQIQKKLNVYGIKFRDIPVLSHLIKFSQIFVGFALSFVYYCCLGYTFWRDGKGLYSSASDGVAIYEHSWKTMMPNALMLACEILLGGVLIVFLVFAFTVTIFTSKLNGDVVAGLMGSLALASALCMIAKGFFDSYLMINTMFEFYAEGQYAEFSDNEYTVLSSEYPKYKNLFAKAQSEPSPASQQPQQDAQYANTYDNPNNY